jgi:hypothetical protein
MKECAFCPASAGLSAEHIIGRWVSEFFPGESTLTFTDKEGKTSTWKSPEVDWKARVVCKKCNNEWMSDIESKYAKPALSPLIRGEVDIAITPGIGRSVALLAFKTAVVLDHAHHRRKPFFSQRIRYAFRERGVMPAETHMWMCTVLDHRNRLFIRASHVSGDVQKVYPVQGLVCTCAIGHFAFQLVHIKQFGKVPFFALPGFDATAKPFWPRIDANLVWPFSPFLRDSQELKRFSRRWDQIAPGIRL